MKGKTTFGVYIDRRVLEIAKGISYSKPNLLDRIKMLFGIEFKPVEMIHCPKLKDLIPRVENMGILRESKSTRRKPMAKFELFKDKKGEYRFNLVANNGKVVCTSEGYKSRRNRMQGIDVIREIAPTAKIEERK